MTIDLATIEEIRVIDTDTHVIEPYDLWTSRVSVKRWGDRVPHVVSGRGPYYDVEDIWVSGDQRLIAAGMSASAGHDKPYPDHPKSWSEVPPETWRAEDRLEMMTRAGIYAQVLYPNVAGFGAGRFGQVSGSDGELALALIQAYNDFLVDYCSSDPARFIPVMGVPFWDIDLSIAEMERSATKGHRGIIFSQRPEQFGCPLLSDRHWDKLWAAAQAMELPVNFHIASGDHNKADLFPEEAGEHVMRAMPLVLEHMDNCRSISSMIGGGVCHRFPELQIVSVESGVGWIPFALQSMDWMWIESGIRTEHPEYDLLPSEYFKRQFYGCFWFEHGPTLTAAIDYLGAEHVLYETDFPHPSGMCPGPASEALAPNEFIATRLNDLPERTLRRILHDNAAALYHLD